MPELPEVEVIRRELSRAITGEIIKSAKILSPGVIAFPSEEEFCLMIKGRKIEEILRKGKYLIFVLSGPLKLIIHLRMTGTLTYARVNNRRGREEKYTRALITLNNGGAISFCDMRKFGRLWLLSPGEEHRAGLHRLGPDWWNEATAEQFAKSLACRAKTPVKSLLLNQGVMAGLGNIYTDESLYRACIHPATPAGCLTHSQVRKLFAVIMDTLAQGIERGGTSIRDYRNTGGNPGGFQDKLLVYQRKGDSCRQCRSIICRIKMSGRGTYYCPNCQKLE